MIEVKQNRGKLQRSYLNSQLQSFNYQKLEYLGDSILNFSIVKRIYFDTALQFKPWQKNCFTSRKLDDIKKFLTSNNFLGILLYNHMISTVAENSHEEHKVHIPLLYDSSSRIFSDEIHKYYKELDAEFHNKQQFLAQPSKNQFSLNNYSEESSNVA